ncbi:MAG: AsmA family protein [Alphaproteobacteria bacterium]
MKKFGKWLGIIVILLVVLIGAGFFAAQQYIASGAIKQQIVAKVKEETGRDLAFDAPRFTLFFPSVGLRLMNVSFSNADWAGKEPMMTLGEMELRLGLKELMNGKIDVTTFVLNKPVIRLETSADGKNNWEFKGGGKPEKTEEKSEGKSGGSSDMARDLQFRLKKFEIKDGTVIMDDKRAKTKHTLEGLLASVTFPDLDSAFQSDGSVTYNGKKFNYVIVLDKPMELVNGKSSKGEVKLNGEGFKFNLNGKLASTGTLFAGNVEADVSPLTDFAKWLQGGKGEKLPFEKVNFKSSAALSEGALKLDNAKLDLDDIDASGDLAVSFSGKPSVKGALSVGKLNLDRFTGGNIGTAEGGGGKSAPKKEEWDATPMDFSGLKALNADLTLKTQGFSLKDAEVSPSTLTILLKDGKLDFASSEATLFGGKFTSKFSLNAATTASSFKFDMEGVDAKPVLTTFADFKKLDGKAYANVDVTSSGSSQKAIIGNLNGSGAVNFKNGSIEGIDLVSIAKMIQSRLAQMDVGKGKTDFVDLGGTFKITKGVAHNEDLKMRGPLVQATGSGDIDLPAKFVKYRVLPVLTASSGVDDAKGLQVPVDIKGPFHNIKVKPDYLAVGSNILENKEALVKHAKEAVKDSKAIIKDIKKDPGAAIDSLLGGGGLFGKKKPPAEELPPEDGLPPEGEDLSADPAPMSDPAPAPAPMQEEPPLP